MRALVELFTPLQATELGRVVRGVLEREKAKDILGRCENRLWRTGAFFTTREDSNSQTADFPEISLVWRLIDGISGLNVAQPDILGLRFEVGGTEIVHTDVMDRYGHWDFLCPQPWYVDYLRDKSQLPPKGIKKGSLVDQARVVMDRVCGGFKQDETGATPIEVFSRSGL